MGQYEEMLFAQMVPYLQWKKEQEKIQNRKNRQLVCKHVFWGETIDHKTIGKECDVLFVTGKDGFMPSNWETELAQAFETAEDACVAYADEDYLGKLSEEITDRFEEELLRQAQFEKTGLYPQEPWFKPEFSPDTLHSFFYFGNCFAVHVGRCRKKKIELFDTVEVSAVHKWMLSLPQEKACFCHIPKILFTNGSMQEADATPDAVDLDKPDALSGMAFLKQKKNLTKQISIIIPSKDHPEILDRCIVSILEKTAYPHYEIIVVDNGSTKENRAWITNRLETLANSQSKSMKYLYESMPFNFSKMCNLGAEHASGEYLLLLNDDMEVIDPMWLTRMLLQAVEEHVGAVGAKLYYPGSDMIQHAGITNMGIGPAHKLGGLSDAQSYYHGRNRLPYNMLAVTAACLMVKKEKYEEAGGMDEELAVAYNDVALCFSLCEKGYYNVQRNDVVLYHHESLSRGQEDSKEKKARLFKEKSRLYEKHPAYKGKDPFYHESLVQWKKDTEYHCNVVFPYEHRQQVQELTKMQKKQLPKMHHNKYVQKLTGEQLSMLQVDGVEQEEDIVIRGWHVLREEDNRFLEKYLLLFEEESGKIYKIKIEPVLRLDVEALFEQDASQNTTGTALAGFEVRMQKDALPDGQYKIGVLTENIPKSWKHMMQRGGKIWTQSLTVLKKS